MAIFGNMSITNAGQALYTKAQSGKPIVFTRMQIGSGQIGTQNPATLVSLVTPQFDVPISSITSNSDLKTATISGTINNSAISSAVYICEIALWAQDPDVGEILYSYASAGTQGDYMAPASQGAYSWNYQINAAVGNAANVTANLSSLLYDYGVVISDTTLTVISGGNQKEINKSIDTKIALHLADSLYQTAGGTATAITLTNVTLENGHPKTFIASADNGGAATTINSIPLYKPGTTTAPTLKLGKAYTVWYNLTGNSFFLKASATGTATPAQVLANVPFSNENDTDLLGSMPNKNAEYAALNQNLWNGGSGNVLYLKVPEGYYKGRTDGIWDSVSNVYSTPQPDLINSNIVSGKSIFGIVGNAIKSPSPSVGDDLIVGVLDNPETTSNNYFTKMKEVSVLYGGTYRIKFDLKASASAYPAHGQIYVNGSAKGTERVTTNLSYTTYSEDFTLAANDLVQLYIWEGNGNQAWCQNLRLSIATSPYVVINLN